MKQKSHSFIHKVQIATPCKADWEKMTGDERVRFCHACKLNVYNIAEMTTEEAEDLITIKEGKVCLRLYRRADGTVLTKDCPKGLAAVRLKMATACGSLLALVTVAASWIAGNIKNGSELGVSSQPVQMETGKVQCQTGGFVQGDMSSSIMGAYAPSPLTIHQGAPLPRAQSLKNERNRTEPATTNKR